MKYLQLVQFFMANQSVYLYGHQQIWIIFI